MNQINNSQKVNSPDSEGILALQEDFPFLISDEKISKPITGLASPKLDFNELGVITLFKRAPLSQPHNVITSKIQMLKTNSDYLFDLLMKEYSKDPSNPNIQPVSNCSEVFKNSHYNQ